MPPHKEVEPYDTHIDDRDLNVFIDQLEHGAFCSLRSALIGLEYADEIDVLAGKKYCNAIQEAARSSDESWREIDEDYEGIAPNLSFPFQEAGLGGIGEQISWLKTALEEHLRRPGDSFKGQVGMDRYQNKVVKS